MRFQFVSTQKAHFSVTDLCSAVEVSTSGYYAWCKREACQRELDDAQLLEVIKELFKTYRETYGSPRIHDALKDLGYKVGKNRVARIMRENGLSAHPKRAWRCITTQSDPTHPVAENVLDRAFSATDVNEKWVTDVTYVDTDEGWLYLAPIIDLYNREVVGWAMSDTNDTELTLSALNMALSTQNPSENLIHHSDRGSNYTASDYCKALSACDIKISMSRKGNCWDNAVAESFFATIKKELIYRCHYKTRREAAASIFEYIEVFYNRVRKHSKLGYTSPAQYRSNNIIAATAA